MGSVDTDGDGMAKWEYLVIEAYTSTRGAVDYYITEERLDEKGKEGWELVSVLGNTVGITSAVFKRRLRESVIR